ncbi:hypothetical protein TNCV_5134721 [Trichonephila clavipes]|nr:hypothetical protein TNCV_5134721 [Trichonephila clavipes]
MSLLSTGPNTTSQSNQNGLLDELLAELITQLTLIFLLSNSDSCSYCFRWWHNDRIGKHPHRPSCRQGKDELNAVPAPHIYTHIRIYIHIIKKVEEQRAHLTPVDSTPKETVPSDTTLNSPSKRTLKNLRLETDKKRLIDDDGFQTPDKRHTANKIGKKNPSLPPTTSQTSNTAQTPPPSAESSDSEIEDEDAGKNNPTAVGPPKIEFLQFLST